MSVLMLAWTLIPSFNPSSVGDYTYLEDRVVHDGNMITSRGPGTTFEFALKIVEAVHGKEKANALIKPMLIKL